MAPQHQHYVPRLLLKGFLSRDPAKASKEQVHVFDLETGNSFTPPIDKIMGETRFNDFWLDDETLATIEPAASRIESRLAPLVENIRATKRLERSREEREDLALLMAFQFIRTKKIRLLPESLDRQIRVQVEEMGFDPGRIKGLPLLSEEILKREHVRHQVQNLDTYAKIIAEKELFLMMAPDGCTFYIGDNPVVMHTDEERKGSRGHLGLGAPYIQIYLPLSADVMLCAYDKAVLGQLMRSNDAEARQIQMEALGMLTRGEITPSQMKRTLNDMAALDVTTPLIKTIRAGEAVAVAAEQVQCYNSLQAFHAHRFVIDPDGKFEVAAEMVAERKAAAD